MHVLKIVPKFFPFGDEGWFHRGGYMVFQKVGTGVHKILYYSTECCYVTLRCVCACVRSHALAHCVHVVCECVCACAHVYELCGSGCECG
jgi:hypothetical protein